MTSLLTNYSFLSPLKRQRVARNRSNNNPTTPSKRANRLPVLPELSGEQDESSSSSSSPSSSISSSSSSFVASSSSTPSRSTTGPKAKRLSRYGKEEFGAFALTDDFLSAPPRIAPQPPSVSSPSSSASAKRRRRRSVCLSEFDIVIDISPSEPASPVSETPARPSTPPRPRDFGRRRRSPPRSRSPTPSLTSMSACSSMEVPTTPGASDDEDEEWPGLWSPPPSDKADVAARPRISKHPLMVIKSTSSVLASDDDTFEFTLVPFSPPPPRLENEGKEDRQEEEGEAAADDDDDALWYSRELSQFVSLSSPRAPANSPTTRPDSLLPLPRGASSASAHSRMSKPLPAIPHATLPNRQLDPTFPQYPTFPPRLTLRASAHPSTPPSPLALPPPASQRLSTSLSSARKSLTITVPRALTTLPKEVSDILDDVNAWSIGTPSASTSSGTRTATLTLSPPRVPHSPAMSMYSEYDPLEFIVSYAARPPSPAPAPSTTPATTCTATAATFLDLEDEDEDEEAEVVADNNHKIHSRWSCSTIATLASPASPTSASSASASTRLRFHLAEVARRVRARRAGGSGNNNGGGGGEGAGTGAVSIRRSGALHIRSSSESALSGPGAMPACSDLWSQAGPSRALLALSAGRQ